ncbi:hypothetical protein IFR05_011477 [Cadophora sp. M221]|nr:hypothetical protein IFR05_011477 [Cadophora sp. M221]
MSSQTVQPSASNSASTAFARVNPHPFDFPAGDAQMLVTYKNQAITCLVCSQALVCASPVWKKFLFPPWVPAPAPTTGPRQIDCSEDDGEALLILLNILHLKFKDVPIRLGYKVLIQVAVLCDQYICVSIAKPWIDGWMREVETDLVAKNFVTPHMLFACWVLGREATFETLAQKLILELRMDKQGRWRSRRGWLVEIPEPMPSHIMDNIKRIRLETIEALLRVPYSAVIKFKRTKKVLCKMSHIASDDSHCDGSTLGTIIRGLDLADLEYGTEAADIMMSIEEVAAAIDDIHIYHLQHDPARPLVDHSVCHARNFQEGVANVLRIVESPVEDSHREHMRAQNSKM